MLQSELSLNAQRFYKCIYALNTVFLSLSCHCQPSKNNKKKARTMLHVQNSDSFLTKRVSKSTSRESVQRYATDNVQCATCIRKKHHHNYDALSFLSCIIFWIFFFLRHCCELLRDFSRFPSNTPRTLKMFWRSIFGYFVSLMIMIMPMAKKKRCCMVHYI